MRMEMMILYAAIGVQILLLIYYRKLYAGCFELLAKTLAYINEYLEKPTGIPDIIDWFEKEGMK